MKTMTAFLTITLLVCIATFVAFANINRDVSHCFLIREGPDDNFPGKYSDEDNTGTDSQGPLWSTGSSWFGYYRNNEGKLRAAASGYGYISCSTDNDNYETRYKSVSVSGDGNGNIPRSGAKGKASASGKNPSNGDQHSTSAESPTSATARDLEIIDD